MLKSKTVSLAGVEFTIRATRIITTDRVILSAWRPVASGDFHTVATDETTGERVGRVGTDAPAAAVLAMPRGARRERTVRAHYAWRKRVALKAIRAAYPDLYIYGYRFGEGEIEVDLHVAKLVGVDETVAA